MRMKQRIWHLLILGLVCAVMFWFQLGGRDFWDRHGEVRRAEVSREMVVSVNWAVPHLNGEPFVTKPPLFYWAAAAMFTATGRFDEWSARVPAAVGGTLCVLVTYLWASGMFTPRTGLFAGLILATSFLPVGMARTGEGDMLLTLFTTTALWCFTIGDTTRARLQLSGQTVRAPVRMFVLAAFIMGFANLTKNPIGLAVPVLAVGALLLATRDWKLLRDMQPWWLALAFLAVMLPWFWLMSQHVPNFQAILHQETIARYTNPDGTPHREAFYFYLPALAGFAPWALFLPGVAASFWAKNRRKLTRPHLLVLLAFLTTFLLFSSVGSKREYYLLPLYPFLAILTAQYWDAYCERKRLMPYLWEWKFVALPVVLFAGLVSVIGLALPEAAHVYLPQAFWWSMLFGILLFVNGLVLLQRFFRNDGVGMFAALTTAIMLLAVFALLTIVPESNAYRSRKDFFQRATAIVGAHAVVDFNYEGYAAQFYMQRIVPVVKEIPALEALAARPETTFVIMPSGQYEILRQASPEIVARAVIVLDQTWTSATNPKSQKRLLLLQLTGPGA